MLLILLSIREANIQTDRYPIAEDVYTCSLLFFITMISMYEICRMREDLKVAYLNEIFGPDADKEIMQIMLRTLEVQCKTTPSHSRHHAPPRQPAARHLLRDCFA